MERIDELENSEICRICLTQNEDANFLDIFDNPSLPMEILSIGSVEVFQSDGMPRKICEICRTILGNAYKFKQICKQSDTLLKRYPVTGEVPARIQIPTKMLPRLEVETATVGVGCDAVETNEMETQTDVKQEEDDDQEMTNEEATAPFSIIEPPAQFSEPDSPNKTLRSLGIRRSNQSNVKILNKAKAISAQPKQFRRASNVRIERIDYTKPKILNSELSSGYDETVIHSIETISGDNMEILTLNQEIQEEHLDEGSWEGRCIEYENQDKSEDQVVYTCDVCPRSFTLQQQLVIHRDNHDRERNHPCDDCDKSFFTKYDLAKHVLTHTKQKDYTCIVCNKSFSRSTLLYRHEKIHSNDPSIQRHQCTECDRVYLNIADFEKHIITHTKLRPFACSYCEKSFAFKQGLERHEISHDYSAQPYPCQYCDLRFPSPAKLQRHLNKAHAGTRPFPCSKCSKRFMLSHHLYRHMSTAHNLSQEVTSFQCPECDEVLENRDDFFNHCHDHASYSLSCPLCKTAFDCNEDVQEHIQNHSVSAMYYCDYCNMIYMSQEDLDQHFSVQHSKELCSVGDEAYEIVVDDKTKKLGEMKKRRIVPGTSKFTKKLKQDDDGITYDIQEIDFLGDDYVEETEVDGASYVEYVDPKNIKAEWAELPTKKEQAKPSKSPAKVEKIRMSASKIEQLKKEGKIKYVNGEMVMMRT